MSDLAGLVGDFNTYFANLQWEFRVFALNRVWERTVKDVPTEYDDVLEYDATKDLVVGKDKTNRSDSIHVSLNDLELSNQVTTIQPTVSVTAETAAVREAYAGLSIPSVRITNVAVTDEPKVVITKTSLTVTEADGGNGDTQQYAVVLATAPSDDVIVTITNPTDSGLTLVPGGGTLTFTTGNWWMGQTVTVTAAIDTNAADPPAVTLTHSADEADTTEGDYDGLAIPSVTVTIKDDDSRGEVDTDEDDDVDDDDDGVAADAKTPRLVITPTELAYALPATGFTKPRPEFTVTLTEITDTLLGANDTVTVTVPVPDGYRQVPNTTDGEPLTGPLTLILDGDPSDEFILRVDPVNIASTQVDLQMRPDDLDAMKDPNTDGGRTKIDLDWDRTYSHDPTPNGPSDEDDKAYAEAYRIQWSTNPDASEWELHPDSDFDDEPMVDTDVCTSGDDSTCMASHTGLYAGTEYSYRIFAKNAEEFDGTTTVNDVVYSWSDSAADTTTDAEKPGTPRNLRAAQSQADGHTEIDLSWMPPIVDDDGVGKGDGFGVIVKYVLEQSVNRSDSWEPLVTLTPAKACSAGGSGATHQLKSKGPVTSCKYTHTGLEPGQTMRYRVATVNIGIPEKTSDWSDTATLKTEESTKPDRPEGLVAEAMGRSMINLMWNIQSRTPPAAPIIAYIIQYLDDDDVWQEAARITDADAADNPNGMVRTIHTDADLPGETERTYRVLAQNMPSVGEYEESAESERATATTADASAPTAPTASATADSDTQITVSWTAPSDDGGADITGYVLQRAYNDADDMMTDFMTIAATDAATWWNTLDCPMMNDAVPADATPAPGSDDPDADPRSPYCDMYDGLSEDAKMVVDATFMANYDTITGMSYMDMGLMPETMYYYRVAAMNSVDLSEYSSDDMASATTDRTNTAPVAGDAIAAQTVTEGMTAMVQSTITDADDTLTWSALSSDDMIATATVDAMGMVTVMGEAPGTATITVTATDAAGESATQMIMVTVEAAVTELTKPTNVRAVSNAAGELTLTWEGSHNADFFLLIAVDLASVGTGSLDYDRSRIDDGMATTGNVTGLNSGSSYLGIVIAVQTDGTFMHETAGTITVQ